MSFYFFNASKLVVKCTRRTTATLYFAFDEFVPTENIHFARKCTKTREKDEKKHHQRLTKRERITRGISDGTQTSFRSEKSDFDQHFKRCICVDFRQHTKLLWNCIVSQQPTNPLEQREHLALIKKKTNSNQPVCSYACYFFYRLFHCEFTLCFVVGLEFFFSFSTRCCNSTVQWHTKCVFIRFSLYSFVASLSNRRFEWKGVELMVHKQIDCYIIYCFTMLYYRTGVSTFL